MRAKFGNFTSVRWLNLVDFKRENNALSLVGNYDIARAFCIAKKNFLGVLSKLWWQRRCSLLYHEMTHQEWWVH